MSEILRLRVAADEAEGALRAAIREACRGTHNPVQHWDGKPQWCNTCGWGDDGFQWRAMPALTPTDLLRAPETEGETP